jgi:hypothetical protein
MIARMMTTGLGRTAYAVRSSCWKNKKPTYGGKPAVGWSMPSTGIELKDALIVEIK